MRTGKSDAGATSKEHRKGGVISPLLANICLHWFDHVFHAKDGPAQWAKAVLVRYADDFVIMARYAGQDLQRFVGEAAIQEVERAREDGGVAPEVLAAIKREPHHRSVADLEKKEDPPAPGEEASFSEKMAHRVATKEGRARDKQRQQTIEPVFGIIKEAIGFRRFSLRGQGKVALEWTLVCVSYNLRLTLLRFPE